MRAVPALLQADYDQDATTFCRIVRIRCKDGDTLALTSLDSDIVYDPAAYDPHGTGDDWGALNHMAIIGAEMSRYQAAADMSVDNAELRGWYDAMNVAEEMFRAGKFNFAKFRVYEINYMALDHGHRVVQTGTTGEAKFTFSQWMLEFRSLTQQLKQPISRLDSLTCRAKFGSKPLGTVTDQPTERYPCNKDWVWVSGTVTSVGTDTRRQFTDTALAQSADHFEFGVVEWLTGDNAGAQMEVDAFALGGAVTLSLPLAYAVTMGDTFRIRQDCDKTFAYCKTVHNNTLNFRGEHLIPVADGGSNLIPGAQISR